MRWLVDAMNVIGSRPDGWWRDRESAMRDLVLDLDSFARGAGEQVTVVFDGGPIELPQPESVEAVFAPSADDAIADAVARDPDPQGVTVVTSDVELAARVRAAGARVTGAGAFRRRLG
jgi:predicted RNA-binding protein with PIN domain